MPGWPLHWPKISPSASPILSLRPVSQASIQWAEVPDIGPNDLDIVVIGRPIQAMTLSFHRAERDFLGLDIALMPEALNHPRVEMNPERLEKQMEEVDTELLPPALSILWRDKAFSRENMQLAAFIW